MLNSLLMIYLNKRRINKIYVWLYTNQKLLIPRAAVAYGIESEAMNCEALVRILLLHLAQRFWKLV